MVHSKHSTYSMTGYEALANSIVAQAAKDYRKALEKLKRNPRYSSALRDKADCESFFQSEWMKELTEVDGRWLMQAIRKEINYDD